MRTYPWLVGVSILVGALLAATPVRAGLDTWTPRDPGVDNIILCVTYGNGQFVALMEGGQAITSPDGITWTKRTINNTNDIYGVVWNGKQYVGVGSRGTVLTSPNGVAWTKHASGTTDYLYSVAWNGSLFMAVGYSFEPGSNVVMTSPNGVAWTKHDSGFDPDVMLADVVSSGEDFFYGVAGAFFTDAPGSGSGGETPSSPAENTTSIIKVGDQFVATNGDGQIWLSENGSSWSSVYTPADFGPSLWALASNGSRVVAVGNSGTVLTADTGVPPPAPGISIQPGDVTVLAGKPAKFTVTASGTSPFTYQWQFSTDGGSTWANVTAGSGLSGTTGLALTLAKPSAADDGAQFRCIVSNANGPTTSDSATLTVHSPPKITLAPANQSAALGQDVAFDVTAIGSSTLTYAWLKDKTSLPSATSSELTVHSVQAADATTYTVTVTNGFGSATAKATLKIIAAAAIVTPPANATVVVGKPAKFSVKASGGAPLAYQWQTSSDNGVSWGNLTNTNGFAGAATAALTIAKTTVDQNNKQFRCLVNNAANLPVASGAAVLKVGSAPSFLVKLQNNSVTVGENSSFSFVLTGTAPFTIQWYKGSTPLPGQTSTILSLETVGTADAGTYRVTVSNAFGSITASATLKVNLNSGRGGHIGGPG